ncbi:hypothetical protein HOA55_01455 [archaeon]|jgi:hypothetical protein|nr:hypothetical protein [archaeon]MBT3578027.1 hypothetical protein [archaeon]MBT6820000.1 hypothetical protein [archaeon]MBT6955704.1 hypothetical protein [archaeon]MBT7025037.1 hypothetical protein [archaeon]
MNVGGVILIVSVVVIALVIGGYYVFIPEESDIPETIVLDAEMGATYELVFTATWSGESHPSDFPSSAHWSGLIGATHNENVIFWDLGGISSDGIKLMAETGGKGDLIKEVETKIAGQNANQVLSGSGISPSPGQARIVFNMSENYPLVTLVSMVAPSPDWFVGVSGLSLYEDENWVDSKEIELFAYDAGTDGGVDYTSVNVETSPRKLISKSDYPALQGSMGKFVFRRLN